MEQFLFTALGRFPPSLAPNFYIKYLVASVPPSWLHTSLKDIFNDVHSGLSQKGFYANPSGYSLFPPTTLSASLIIVSRKIIVCDDFRSIRLDVYLRESVNAIMATIRFRQLIINESNSISLSFVK